MSRHANKEHHRVEQLEAVEPPRPQAAERMGLADAPGRRVVERPRAVSWGRGAPALGER